MLAKNIAPKVKPVVISPATPVTLQEKSNPRQDPSPLVIQLVQREGQHLEKLFDTKLFGLQTEIYTTLAGKDNALQLQAHEYERRLTALNHAHVQAVERCVIFLPREIYEDFKKDFYNWQRILDAERAINAGQRTAYLSIAAAGISLLSLAFVAYGVVS